MTLHVASNPSEEARADQIHAEAVRAVKANMRHAREAMMDGVSAQHASTDLAEFLQQHEEADRDAFAFLAAVAIVEAARLGMDGDPT